MSEQAYRTEHDTMGEVQVPADAKYRSQTQRAVENFPVSGQRIERAHIEALARIKAAAAKVNARARRAGARPRAGGAGRRRRGGRRALGRRSSRSTSSRPAAARARNMNTNEVLATLATERLGRPVHPNDHVNASQSSNDVFPSSIHVAATSAVVHDLVPALEHLAAEPGAQARRSGPTS